MKFSEFKLVKIQNTTEVVGGGIIPTQSIQMTHYPWYDPRTSKGDTDKDRKKVDWF